MVCGIPKDGYKDFKSKAALKRYVDFLKRNKISLKKKTVRVRGIKKKIKI